MTEEDLLGSGTNPEDPFAGPRYTCIRPDAVAADSAGES